MRAIAGLMAVMMTITVGTIGIWRERMAIIMKAAGCTSSNPSA